MVKKINTKLLKRILTISYIALVVTAMLLLVLCNTKSFVFTTSRFKEVFNIEEVKIFFELDLSNSKVLYEEIVLEVTNDAASFLSKVYDFFSNTEDRKIMFSEALSKLFDAFCDFLIYFCNFGINTLMVLLIYFNETFNATRLNTNKTVFAKAYLFIFNIIKIILTSIKKAIKWTCHKLYEYRRFIALNIFLYILSNGLLYRILVEILILIVVYIYRTILTECYVVIFAIFKWIIVKLYPVLKGIPGWVYVPALIVLIFLNAISKAEYRLTQNHERLKKFVKNDLTQTTFINGAPGAGKTLLNVSLSLASEEMFIETLEDKMLDHEIKYPVYNFALIRLDKDLPDEHKEYLKDYETIRNRNSYIISNFAIYSPYFNDYSKIFDFNFMRKNIKIDKYALEEYIVIAISELDKEYNSHDDMKRVGSDGAATFFSTVSHDLKRHVKIFCDYQLKDQVPLRIRGNSEFFYMIEERKKKYPFLLGLYYLPIRFLTKMVRNLILKYETTRKTINKKTKRKTYSVYKRNDVSMLYVILRQLAYGLYKISDWFDHYWYFRIKGNLSMQDGAKGEERNILLNICDLSIENMALYDSTFLSYAYEQKKNAAFKDLERFTSLTPSIEELTKCNSHFYNKINGLESFDEDEKDNKYDESGDFITINN